MEEFRNYDDRNEMKSKRVECKKYMTENERLEHCDEIPHWLSITVFLILVDSSS